MDDDGGHERNFATELIVSLKLSDRALMTICLLIRDGGVLCRTLGTYEGIAINLSPDSL